MAEPKLREIVSELSSNIIGNGALFAMMPYIAPTFIQALRKPDSNSENINSQVLSKRLEYLSYNAGLVFGVCLIGLQIAGYSLLSKMGYSEALILPAVTNQASLCYEVGKAA